MIKRTLTLLLLSFLPLLAGAAAISSQPATRTLSIVTTPKTLEATKIKLFPKTISTGEITMTGIGATGAKLPKNVPTAEITMTGIGPTGIKLPGNVQTAQITMTGVGATGIKLPSSVATGQITMTGLGAGEQPTLLKKIPVVTPGKLNVTGIGK